MLLSQFDPHWKAQVQFSPSAGVQGQVIISYIFVVDGYYKNIEMVDFKPGASFL